MIENLKKLPFTILGSVTTYRLGRAMYMHARGDVANSMTNNGELLLQEHVLRGFRSTKPSGKLVVFDVGANVGDWSLAILERAKKDAGLAMDLFLFEPVPSTAQTLRRNLSQYSSRLRIEELALSSTSGSTQIFVKAPNLGTNSLHDDGSSLEKQGTPIRMVSASDFCDTEGIQHVHLLKCDTEGHDIEVIRGALPLFRNERISVMQFEYNHRWVFSRSFLRDVFINLDGLRYKIAKVQPNRLMFFKSWDQELEKFFEGNYAIVHVDAIPWFTATVATVNRYNAISEQPYYINANE